MQKIGFLPVGTYLNRSGAKKHEKARYSRVISSHMCQKTPKNVFFFEKMPQNWAFSEKTQKNALFRQTFFEKVHLPWEFGAKPLG